MIDTLGAIIECFKEHLHNNEERVEQIQKLMNKLEHSLERLVLSIRRLKISDNAG